MEIVCDLHIHSCLSPCADNDMTPANIAGMAHVAGVQLISVCDHNSAENLPAVKKSCDEYGVFLLPGIEANTAEEIHVLCYFPTVETALDMSNLLYEKLPPVPCKEEIYGEQIMMNERDEETGRAEKLLINATALTLDETVKETKARGGVCVPAHIDRDSYSVISALGLMPEQPFFETVEFTNIANRDKFIYNKHITEETEILLSSDAHYLQDIAREEHILDENSVLWELIQRVCK